MNKTQRGNFFEDFAVGRRFRHATPRTVTDGDVALYTALTGSRFAVNASVTAAACLGHLRAPLDDLLVFHLVFGKTVPDVSLNAVANLGYADCVFGAPVYPGDTLHAESEVIGVRQNSRGDTGTVYVRSTGFNQRGEVVLDYVRWVMVRKADPESPAPDPVVPEVSKSVSADRLLAPDDRTVAAYDTVLSGSDVLWEDYSAGEKIDHVDGVTVESAEHMAATRLYHNTARAHFDQYAAQAGRFGHRIVYGGHIMSLARAVSVNGLANAFRIAAINGGRHVLPVLAGDTVYAWTEVLERIALPGRSRVGALRLRAVATRDLPCESFPYRDEGDAEGGKYHPAVVLDLDYTVLIPRRGDGAAD
ncbi:MAG: hypothetical protein CMM50_08565 [Rhodospirillaceae bacterium]|nr:hypothetical protein [Rhodospirillaceae bacterium]